MPQRLDWDLKAFQIHCSYLIHRQTDVLISTWWQKVSKSNTCWVSHQRPLTKNQKEKMKRDTSFYGQRLCTPLYITDEWSKGAWTCHDSFIFPVHLSQWTELDFNLTRLKMILSAKTSENSHFAHCELCWYEIRNQKHALLEFIKNTHTHEISNFSAALFMCL